MQLSDNESLAPQPAILSRPAATLLEFSEDGKQVAEQSVVFFPRGGISKKSGPSVTIALRNFVIGDMKSIIKGDYFIDPKAECAEPRKIIYIKNKPDSVRDELNPYLPGEQ